MAQRSGYKCTSLTTMRAPLQAIEKSESEGVGQCMLLQIKEEKVEMKVIRWAICTWQLSFEFSHRPWQCTEWWSCGNGDERSHHAHQTPGEEGGGRAANWRNFLNYKRMPRLRSGKRAN